jgi:hypothetical protein
MEELEELFGSALHLFSPLLVKLLSPDGHGHGISKHLEVFLFIALLLLLQFQSLLLLPDLASEHTVISRWQPIVLGFVFIQVRLRRPDV